MLMSQSFIDSYFFKEKILNFKGRSPNVKILWNIWIFTEDIK